MKIKEELVVVDPADIRGAAQPEIDGVLPTG